MADFAFNIAKGRIVELYSRVKNNDPANSALILVPCSASDTEANAQDADTLTAALATAINEQTSGGWVRKTLTDAELAAVPGPDDTANTNSAPLPQVTWTTPSAGNNVTGLLVCYDPDTTSGNDSNILPLTHHTWAVTANGADIVLLAGTMLVSA